jgi:quercetin dioxygenase-like cupin family protein
MTDAQESEWVVVSEGFRRRVREDGEKLMVVELEAGQGCGAPLHQHPHEQVSYVISGRMRFTVDGQTRDVARGESIHIPSNALHTAVALEDSVALDIFSPPREDFRR